jgi:hypothetical protein
MRARRPAARCGGRERGRHSGYRFVATREADARHRRFANSNHPDRFAYARHLSIMRQIRGRQLRHAPTSCRTLRPCQRQEGKRTGQAGDDGRARYRARCASSTSAVDRTCGVRAARNETLGETTCAPPAHHSHSPSAFQRKRTNAYPRTGVPGPRYVRSTLEDPARLLRRRDRRLHAGIRMAVGADPLQRPP